MVVEKRFLKAQNDVIYVMLLMQKWSVMLKKRDRECLMDWMKTSVPNVVVPSNVFEL
jgi:hypothetical protein